jgi:hypothetical protein
MPAKVKESLFDLIKSLTKSEKRYFKIQSSLHTIGQENNYVRLFDYIDKLDYYDEDVLFKEFKGQAFLNRFSITKKRLYDHILDALSAFHASNSSDAQLYKSLHCADILYAKSLYDQCARELRSAEKQAEKQENFSMLILIRSKQKKLIENSAYSDTTALELNEIQEKDTLIVSELTTYNQLWKIKSDLFFHLARKGKARSIEERAVYEKILFGMPNYSTTDHLPFESAYLYNHIQAAFWFAVGEMEKSYTFIQANLATFTQRKGVINTHLNSYFSLLTNAIYVSEKLGYHQDSSSYLHALKQIDTNYDLSHNEDLHIKLFASSSSIELSLLTHRGDYSKAQELMPAVEHGLVHYGTKISPIRRAFIQFKLASMQLALGNYTVALKWINAILNEASELEDNEDILSYTQILDLLVHMELKHDKLLPYALKNTHRFLKTRNRLYTFEKVFLQFISKQIKCANALDMDELWEELYHELSAVKEDSFDGLALEYFDFISWAESKYTKKPFILLMKEKFNTVYRDRSEAVR